MVDDKYEITVSTGTKTGAGTDADVSVTLLGTAGTSGPHKLDKRFHDDFEPGQTDQYTVKAPDLGDLIGLRFQVAEGTLGIGGDWYMTRAHVTRGDDDWDFSCYAWLRSGGSLTIQEESARLPQHADLTGESDLRRMQIMQRRESFPWRASDGALPGALDISPTRPVPVDEKYRDLKESSYQVIFAKTMLDMKLTTNILKRVWNSIDDVNELFAKFALPPVAKRWRDDLEFARQTVQGVSPVHIELISEIPADIDCDENLAYGLLEPGMSLAQALADNRMFMTDFAELIGIALFDKTAEDGTVEKRYAHPARGLFYRHSDGHLRPVAIQCERGGLVFTPKDDEYDWLAAKMHLRCAEGNVHQLLPHALHTHLVMEPFVMATLRNLAASHPVYKLMRRHLRYTLAINEGARSSLLAPGGVFDNFMATGGPDQGHLALLMQGYVDWKLEHNNPRKNLAARGVLDALVLPYYPYRDDGIPIWDAIGEYVQKTLALFYPDDQSLIDDNEMQDWWTDLTTAGHAPDKMPCAELTKISDLEEVLSIVIWTVSAQHPAVNYQQYHHYAFVPNAPLCLREPAPTQRGKLDERGIVEMLPSKSQATWQVAIGRALASFGKDEEYLHNPDGFHEEFFEENAAVEVLEGFERTMHQIDQATRKRNKTRPVPYVELLPSRVPTSITI